MFLLTVSIVSPLPVINGEKATLETPTFAQKRQRTLDMLIRSLCQDLMPDLHKNMLNRRSFSDVLPESPKSARKKEEARQAEFVRIGQALKLKTIVRGDAPTSLATTGLCRREPWESHCFCSNFCEDVAGGDSWGPSLLVSTDSGVLLIDDGQPAVPVFDRSLQIRQMHVLESLDLLITRADKGKDARLYVFRLSTIRKDLEDNQVPRNKYECRENKLEKTKGCHLYAINTHHSQELRVVVAIRNKLLLITRKHSATHSTAGASPVEAFQYIRVHFVAAIDVYEDGEAGILLCYNYSCYYKKVSPFNGGSPLLQPSASDFYFSWNQVPHAVVCAFPYILAFTTDSIEIRLVVNGNLVHTAVVPDLQLVASRSDIYFKASTTMDSSSNSSSRDTSSRSSPQTPSGYDLPAFPSTPGEGEVQGRNIYKIPLSNLVGRSIERPLKSPLVPKEITPTSGVIACSPVTHSLSLSRMEIKEIASRTRKELLGLSAESASRSEGSQRPKKQIKKAVEEGKEQETGRSSTDR
ncbi:unnamed protein product [Ranitomeya imitator]|uniref:CNH domain-containing protein n=1 Tax=Ranitomeya imitator TaxID=111125 RepID=A0ABN9LW74_9NEOB|nr:unnamed protein product [Ranitomeya imitator]